MQGSSTVEFLTFENPCGCHQVLNATVSQKFLLAKLANWQSWQNLVLSKSLNIVCYWKTS